jgi:Ankyrin repeats (many copies)
MDSVDFIHFVQLIVDGERDQILDQLGRHPSLATIASPVGATRQESRSFFFESISHYLYVGDTALHMAAAAFDMPITELLIAHGANCRAKNRMRAEPIHYAADAHRRDSDAQAAVITYLVLMGADPNASSWIQALLKEPKATTL